MKITWKDSRTFKTYIYRGHTISRHPKGWVTTVPGDMNIYYTAEHAHNAVDQMLGGTGRKKNPGRHKLGIIVVGTKDGVK